MIVSNTFVAARRSTTREEVMTQQRSRLDSSIHKKVVFESPARIILRQVTGDTMMHTC